MKTAVVTKTQVTRNFELDWFDIVDLLKKKVTIRDDARISVLFRVPSGGDWSGESISITSENPVLVTVIEET